MEPTSIEMVVAAVAALVALAVFQPDAERDRRHRRSSRRVRRAALARIDRDLGDARRLRGVYSQMVLEAGRARRACRDEADPAVERQLRLRAFEILQMADLTRTEAARLLEIAELRLALLDQAPAVPVR